MSDLNDPRVFFAAERTLLAWNRTSLALMAFGFVIERFGLFVAILMPQQALPLQRGLSFWTGLAFVVLGAAVAAYSTVQFRKVLKTLKPVEIPEGYRVSPGIVTNLSVALLGIALTIYFFMGV
jgi:putative membrane protein